MFTILCIKVFLLLFVIYCTICYNVLSLGKCENKLKFKLKQEHNTSVGIIYIQQAYTATPDTSTQIYTQTHIFIDIFPIIV